MSTTGLVEWRQRAKGVDVYDVLYQLAILAASNHDVGCEPSDLAVDEDNKVQVVTNDSNNLAWQAPEIIFDSNPNPSSVGPNQRLFTVALMGYWMLSGRDYYTENAIDLLSLPSYVAGRSSVIDPNAVSRYPVGPFLVRWTSVDPTMRGGVEGVANFIKFMSEAIEGRARLSYVCDKGWRTAEVHSETLAIEDQLVIESGRTIDTPHGTYRVTDGLIVPYRPGQHPYTVKVTKVPTIVPGKTVYIPRAYATGREADFGTLELFLDLRYGNVHKAIPLKTSFRDLVIFIVQVNEDGSTTNLRSIKIPKPAGYAGKKYVVNVAYDAGPKALYVRLDDASGNHLEFKNLGSV